MKCKWYEIPIRVERNGEALIIPANEVESGDKVWFCSGVKYISDGCIADDEEEIMYIKINKVDCWPAAMFVSE